MRRSTTYFTILISFVLAFIVLAPLLFSFWLSSHYQSTLSQLNRFNNLEIKVTHFSRGWFVSHATIDLTLWKRGMKPKANTVMALGDHALHITLEQQITNGPWFIAKFGDRHQLFIASALIHSKSNDPDLSLTSTTLIKINHDVDNVTTAKHLVISNGEQQLDISDFKLNLNFIAATQQLITNTSIALVHLSQKQNLLGLQPAEDKTKWLLQNLTVRTNTLHQNPLWSGERNFSAEKITIVSGSNTPIEIENGFVRIMQLPKNPTTTIVFQGHANRVNTNTLTLEPFDIKLTMSELNTAALTKLNQWIKTLHEVPRFSLGQLNLAYSNLMNLLKEGLVLNLDYIRAHTKEGPVNATASLKFAKQTTEATVASLFANAEGHLSVEAPRAWLTTQLQHFYDSQKPDTSPIINNTASTSAEALIEDWLAKRKLVQEGTQLKSDVSYNKGQFLINASPTVVEPPLTIVPAKPINSP